ncbi:chemotaxis protein CheD [Tropicimonas marinistellae]|uniref:chemotaxis protein CheD n=1 Tax=Tropicimonas marinistellae TaxID=1739787 RepID=UPI000835A165|nr:chemotaxis protein CheD [Tropicimonas marinistellae]
MGQPGQTFHIGQGELAVSADEGAMLTAVLGSCVAACIWDPDRGVGGMNHILLPEGKDNDMRRKLYGTNAMELLINRLLQNGAERRNLRAKLFGGARMIAGLSDIGARNSQFVREFCQREEISVAAMSLGGTDARRIQFWPRSGKVRQRVMTEAPVRVVAPTPKIPAPASDVELF